MTNTYVFFKLEKIVFEEFPSFDELTLYDGRTLKMDFQRTFSSIPGNRILSYISLHKSKRQLLLLVPVLYLKSNFVLPELLSLLKQMLHYFLNW